MHIFRNGVWVLRLIDMYVPEMQKAGKFSDLSGDMADADRAVMRRPRL